MKRFYRLSDNPKKVINIDDISMFDFDESIHKYIVFINGLKNCIFIEESDANIIMDKLHIINDLN